MSQYIDATGLDAELAKLREAVESARSLASEARGIGVGNGAAIQKMGDNYVSLAAKVAANTTEINRLKGQPVPNPGPGEPDPGNPPTPPTPPVGNKRLIGMNSGFVGRSGNPDDPTLPGYSDKLRPVCGCYRPMNWSRINDDTTAYDSLDETHKYLGITWRELLKQQVAVANAVDADFYWNAPIRASSKFWRDSLAFIRAKLNTGKKVYATWGNECWNASMGTYKWIKASTATADKPDGYDPGSGDNPFMNLWGASLDLFFKNARQGDPTCIRVVETKTARDGEWFSYEITKRMTSDYDAVAGTLYFGPHYSAGYWDGITVDQMMDEARKEWERDDVRWQDKNIAWAKERGKLAIAYEAGQHYHQYGYTAQTRACQSHPGMRQLYKDVYGNAIAKGIDLILDFDFLDWDNDHGHWGKADALGKLDTSLKYNTLLEIAAGLN